MLSERRGRRWSVWFKTVRVHEQAARSAPGLYCSTVWLKITGKRLRSRNRLAVLLGRTPAAYALWRARFETPHVPSVVTTRNPPLIALIDTSGNATSPRTLRRELEAQGIASLLIGGPDGVGLADAAEQIDWTAAPWLLAMPPEDRLAPGAADLYRRAVGNADPETRVIYADDDLIDAAGTRHSPHFKPRWNAELFRYHDYLTDSCIVRAEQADLAACAGIEGWRRALICRLVGHGDPLHCAQVLHHRRHRPQPRVPRMQALDHGAWPSVTIIIPTRNRRDLLKTCIDGVMATDYPQTDIIVVDNDSDDAGTLIYLAQLETQGVQVLHHPGPFNFSALVNRAVELSHGELVCLLNNDIEVLSPNWLKCMASQAKRDDVGAVGAQLLYPDGRIQHAGVVIGMGGAAGHAHRLLHPDEPGYHHRHALPQFVSAVTGACLLVSRERFLAVGGLDEHALPVAFNDVDLCLKLNQRGWQSFYEPRARLVHHESLSRGLDQDPVGAARFAGELRAFRRTWASERAVDPFHHPHLSRLCEQFVLGL